MVIYKIINKQIFSTNVDREKRCQWKKLLEKGNENVKYKDLKTLNMRKSQPFSYFLSLIQCHTNAPENVLLVWGFAGDFLCWVGLF